MKKRITAILMAAVMVLSAVGVTTTNVNAATTTPYMTVESGPVKEKVGNYYIWVKTYLDEEEHIVKEELRSSKKATGKGVVLKTLTGDKNITTVISNGKTIYYGVSSWNEGGDKMTIYKTSVTGGKSTVFRTIKGAQSNCGPITVFNNRLYYDRDVPDINGRITWNIYSVNLKNKDCRLEKAGFAGQSGYGRYITCDNEFKNTKTQLFNAKTKKSTSLIKSGVSRVYNGNIYYATGDDWNCIKKTNYAGKKLTTLGTIKDTDYSIIYLGKKMAYFEDWETGAQKKLTYSTKKIVDVK